MGTKAKKKPSRSAIVKKGWATRRRNGINRAIYGDQSAIGATLGGSRQLGLPARKMTAEEAASYDTNPSVSTEGNRFGNALGAEAMIQPPPPNAEPTSYEIMASAIIAEIATLNAPESIDLIADRLRRMRVEGEYHGVEKSAETDRRELLRDFLRDVDTGTAQPNAANGPFIISWSTVMALRHFLWKHYDAIYPPRREAGRQQPMSQRIS